MRLRHLVCLGWSVSMVVGCAAGRRGDDDDGDPGGEVCANGYDDDGDHLVDCFDPDCTDLAMCAPLEVCGNEIDDDEDGTTDCQDADCSWRPECGAAIETNCGNRVDDDGDGLVDCDEPECAADAACREHRTASVDCDAVCAHESACGTDSAGPNCVAQCRCSVDQMLNPEFASGYFGCRLGGSCGELSDPNACLEEASSIQPTTEARNVIASCGQRQDCAGFPCEMLSMLSDDLLADVDACLAGSDCFTCIDVSSTCP